MRGRARLALALLVLLPGAAAAQDEPPGLLNPLAAIARDSLKSSVERPLFEPSRRPPAVAAPLLAAPPPPRVEAPPMLRLIGVVEGEGSLSAIVQRLDGNRTETLRSGDRVDGWSVEVMPGALRVQNGGRAFDYLMFRGPRQGPAPVVPAGGVTPQVAPPIDR